ncbi:histidine kinase dimerization/phosphoacceptor domain -containing protein [Mucilaginibacter sp.]|uniref:tetratricopeptide repeat-containing sensor histidine kinase n=1 Tax=Mucilaginibacter sp. TaxID=1882438 RepID=UPI0025EC979E|nr:histidine kinase dimerization/phosphoacceptor domain -containing protein [Mucilaginibacter sp.]
MLKASLILLLIIAAPYACLCQTSHQDKLNSLNAKLRTARPDTNQLNILHQLGSYYLERHFRLNKPDLDSAFVYFKRENSLSTRLQVDGGSGRLESLCSLGTVYLSRNMLDSGKAYFMQVVDFYKKNGDKQQEAETWERFGKTTEFTNWPVATEILAAKVIDAYKNAVALFTVTGDRQREIMARYNLAHGHFKYTYIYLAEDDCMQAIEKYGKSSYSNMGAIYFVLAHIQRYRGNMNKALYYILESIRLMDKSHDTTNVRARQASLFGELAEVYDALGQTDNSITWYKKTLSLRENLPLLLEQKYRTAGFIVKGLIKQKKNAEALALALGVEKRHPPDNNYDKAIITQIKAYCYEALKDYKKAEVAYVEMMRLYPKTKADEIVSLAKYDIAKFYITQKKFDRAAFYLDEEISKYAAVTRARDFHFIIYKIDSAKGDYLSALQHQYLFKQFNDSIFNSNKSREIQELQVKYETEQKERDIKLLTKDGLLQHEKAIRANNTRNLTLAISALLIFLLGLIYNSYRAKQRSNVKLNTIVNEKGKLLSEKEWLLKEIHHRVKNNLQIVMGLLQRQSAYIDNDEALAAIQNSENRMHSIALIHQKLYQSENLDLICMQEYIDEMISYLKDSSGLDNRIIFEKQIDELNLDVAQAVPLGLIMNEAITNAIKYAYKPNETGVIYISLLARGNGCNQLTIADNGPGLPAEFDINKIESLGINLMRGLTKQLGGAFDITNEQGCIINIDFKTEIFNRVTVESQIILT